VSADKLLAYIVPPSNTRGNSVFDNKINVGTYSLAVLPINYLSRLGCPFEQLCKDQGIDPDYREVFTAGIRSYQLVTYLKLIREHYGRGVASPSTALSN
jgi:hypothetical protein